MRKLSTDTVTNVLYHFDNGKSYTEIKAATGASHAIISRVITKHRPGVEKPKGGRPQKLSENDRRHAQRLIISGHCDSTVDVVNFL